MKGNLKFLVFLYADIEAYPPTLNVINLLHKFVDSIHVTYRAKLNLKSNFDNVFFYPSNFNIGYEKQIHGSLFIKFFLYISYIHKITKLRKKIAPDWIIVYDPIALLLFSISSFFSKNKSKIWYHNHDIIEPKHSWTSLSYWIARNEKLCFSRLDIFSLPAREREIYFPLNQLNGVYHFLPNYPSLEIYSSYFMNRKTTIEESFKILFQGSIGRGHGIEEMIQITGFNKGLNKTVFLYLKGSISGEYKNELIDFAKSKNVSEYLIFFPYTNYVEVPKLCSECHLGIAIFTGQDVMNNSLGTASNKIYEYAAVGTPIIYFDNEHFRKYLDKENWAFSTDLSIQSLNNIIQVVDSNFSLYSNAAYSSFQNKFNFEKEFNNVLGTIFSNSISVLENKASNN